MHIKRETKVLITLPFFANGSYQRPAGSIEGHHVAEQTVSSVIAQICDANMQILSVDASNPSATHDSYIWSTHPSCARLQNLSIRDETWSLGDSGYP
ncbi:hypothetical protein PYW08_006997 [Mythimna loreyi]|uniref:Uncharacterized protein n=1 Tax=Mythimna loreyi TaxID=667449 RepID=A0ACC2RAM5_9NEOP|nr:hypothetical protein PYW08_006997 [Mythimna loreyi]